MTDLKQYEADLIRWRKEAAGIEAKRDTQKKVFRPGKTARERARRHQLNQEK